MTVLHQANRVTYPNLRRQRFALGLDPLRRHRGAAGEQDESKKYYPHVLAPSRCGLLANESMTFQSPSVIWSGRKYRL
jgi:hypothetical protein